MNQSTHRILFAHYRGDIVSGAENSLADLVANLNPKFDVTMLVPEKGKLSDFFHKRNLQVMIRNLETPRRLYPGLHTLQSFLFAKDIRKAGFDALVCNTFASASRAATSARIANIPLGIYMRDYVPVNKTHSALLDRADAVFAISKDVAAHTSQMAPDNKIHLTYNYINPDPIWKKAGQHKASAARLLPYPIDLPVIGLVGRITRYKQPDIFLRAIPFILKEHPNARFVVIGSAQQREQQYQHELFDLSRQLGIENCLTFLGQRSDVVELTSELTISCLVSDREPLGRVLLEAHLLKVPVVASNTGGAAEIVEDEITGLQFSPNSSTSHEELARQIIRLLNDPVLRKCMADAGYERIMHTFANPSHIRIQEYYFEKLCAREL